MQGRIKGGHRYRDTYKGALREVTESGELTGVVSRDVRETGILTGPY